MRAVIIDGIKEIAIHELPTPILAEDEILCRVVYSGICGTDLAIYSGDISFVKNGQIKYPVRFGHEWSGYVEAVGEKVTKFKPGDRVVSDNGITCRKCKACKEGDMDGCENIMSVGTINCWAGSFGEYIVIPECHLYHLPDCITYKNAATIEPLTVAYAAMHRYTVTPDMTVAVIGTGSIGMSAVALAKTMGAGKVIMVGRNPAKLDVALKVGATHLVNNTKVDPAVAIAEITGGRMADIVVETSGAPTTIQEALNVAAPKSDVALIGFYEEMIKELDINPLVSKQLRVRGIMGEFGLVPQIIDYMAASGLSLEPMISKEINFEDVTTYFEEYLEKHRSDIKVLVKMSD